MSIWINAMRKQLTVNFFGDVMKEQEGCIIREATILEVTAALMFLQNIKVNGQQFDVLKIASYTHDILKIFRPCLTFFPHNDDNIINELGASDLMDVIDGLMEVNAQAMGKLINSLMELLPKMGLPTPTLPSTVPLNDSNTGSFS